MVSHTLCNNTHPPTILRFTINVCNNQSKSLHVQNEKETNNEAGNEHTPTTMLHDLVFNHRLKKHSYPQLKIKSLIIPKLKAAQVIISFNFFSLEKQ